MTEAAERSWCTRKAVKDTSYVCPAPCALHTGEPSHTGKAPLLPSLPQLENGGRYFFLCNDLPDAACWRWLSFLWLCLNPSLPGRGREVMEVGRLLLVMVVWVLTLICVTSLSLSCHSTSFLLSLFTSLHITRTWMHTHTHRSTHTHQGLGKLHKAVAPWGGDVNLFPLQNRHCHRGRTATNSTAGQPAFPNSPKLKTRVNFHQTMYQEATPTHGLCDRT